MKRFLKKFVRVVSEIQKGAGHHDPGYGGTRQARTECRGSESGSVAMSDPRFFSRQGPFDLATLAEIGGAEIGTTGEQGRILADIAPLDLATSDDLSFLDNAA